MLILELGWAVSSPLAQKCKAWMPLHRFMSPAPKIAQALKDTFHISCSRTSGRERSFFRSSCCSSIRREVQAAASWSPGQNKARRFETLLSHSLSNVLFALPHFSENFSHVLLPVLFTPHHRNIKTSLDKSKIPMVSDCFQHRSTWLEPKEAHSLL